MVQRRGKPALKGFGGDGSSSSSDSDDDAFAAMSKKKKKKKPRISISDDVKQTETSSSSTKRHHHVNATRQAKMDSLLQELQTAKPSESTSRVGGGDDYYGTTIENESYYGRVDRYAPTKKGSYVEPGMEHLTTNLFVGNLDPLTTEEELTDAFRQFGDLYSVKIMWPRTAEERSRNRNTGFVCFMHRADAEDAMDSLCEQDPLGTGRRMVLRWGKNVKKTVKRGTGGVPLNLRKKPRDNPDTNTRGTENQTRPTKSNHSSESAKGFLESTSHQEHNSSTSSSRIINSDQTLPSQINKPTKKAQPLGPIYDPVENSADAIVVNAPSDSRRLQFISTVASFVAKDGSIFEQKLIETQSYNSDFRFLTPRDDGISPNDGSVTDDHERFEEHIFYRWRVYAFAQGDGFSNWRTDPFVMFEPHGRFWIPPPLNTRAAQEEEEAEKRREDIRLAAQEERRKIAVNKQDCIKTGAQLKRTGEGEIRLNEWERNVFNNLLREKLCASQESICEAMTFCFDKALAAREISGLLKEALLEAGNVSVDTRIARLFLLSDILFNSQQPGVRNAFHYRDSIETMTPDVFEGLGKHGGGRMTMNKLRKAVSSVLSAWTNWSVFNSDFIDELECKFEGREISVTGKLNEDEQIQKDEEEKETEVQNTDADEKDDHHAAVSTTPRGTWTAATNEVDAKDTAEDIDGEAIDDDVDGEALDDLDGEEIACEELIDEEIDGEELDDDAL